MKELTDLQHTVWLAQKRGLWGYEIARLLQKDKAEISRILKVLKKKGYTIMSIADRKANRQLNAALHKYQIIICRGCGQPGLTSMYCSACGLRL